MNDKAEKQSLVIGNTIAEIARVVEFVERFGDRHDVPRAVVNDLNLCIDELLNNTISYGYDDCRQHRIVVDLSIADGRLKAEIRDDGKPFDPRQPAPVAKEASLRSRATGGLGLHFIKALMDDLVYKRVGAMNVVTISKRLGGANDGSC
jgi:anti-sigma regulatory factor (Ser/Thr protein kinase)